MNISPTSILLAPTWGQLNPYPRPPMILHPHSITITTPAMISRTLLARFTSTMATPPIRQRFAPLNPSLSASSTAPKLAGVVFDVDGTLCEPQTWMFAKMRAALGIAKTVDILDHVYTLAPDIQNTAMESIRDVEREAMTKMIPQRGLLPLMEYLEKQGVQKAICTRNFDTPVNFLIENFCQGQIFSPIVTREFRPPKPDPAGILHIAEKWGLEGGGRLIMVGDSMDDMAAGRRAGAATVLLKNNVNGALVESEMTDCVIDRLDELIEILENGFVERDRSASPTS